MRELVQSISVEEVLLAACIAYMIWFFVMRSGALSHFLDGNNTSTTGGKKTYGDAEMHAAGQRCEELFPIVRISFGGEEYLRGMQVEIRLQPDQTIIGELIGMNKINLVCVRTKNQILALRLEKINSIRKLDN